MLKFLVASMALGMIILNQGYISQTSSSSSDDFTTQELGRSGN